MTEIVGSFMIANCTQVRHLSIQILHKIQVLIAFSAIKVV